MASSLLDPLISGVSSAVPFFVLNDDHITPKAGDNASQAGPVRHVCAQRCRFSGAQCDAGRSCGAARKQLVPMYRNSSTASNSPQRCSMQNQVSATF